MMVERERARQQWVLDNPLVRHKRRVSVRGEKSGGHTIFVLFSPHTVTHKRYDLRGDKSGDEYSRARQVTGTAGVLSAERNGRHE